MSLINEALKKAQKQRTGEAPPLASMPSIGGQSPQSFSRRAPASGGEGFLLRIGIGAAAFGLVGLGLWFLMGGKSDKPAAAPTPAPVVAATTPAPAPVTVAPVTKPAPVVAETPKPEPAVPTFTVPIKPPAPKTEPVTVAKSEPPPIHSAPAPAATPAEPPARKPVAPGKLEPRAINFIEAIRVAGIRASASDSKVLMNDRVYRLNDLVEAEMGLKLVGITANSLTFEDERGGRYTRNF